MSIDALKQQHFNEQDLRRLMDQLYDWSEQFQSIDILDGRHIKDIEVTTSTTEIEHKLGREPEGYIITSQNADARIWETARSTTALTLDASATVTISIWVF